MKLSAWTACVPLGAAVAASIGCSQQVSPPTANKAHVPHRYVISIDNSGSTEPMRPAEIDAAQEIIDKSKLEPNDEVFVLRVGKTTEPVYSEWDGDSQTLGQVIHDTIEASSLQRGTNYVAMMGVIYDLAQKDSLKTSIYVIGDGGNDYTSKADLASYAAFAAKTTSLKNVDLVEFWGVPPEHRTDIDSAFGHNTKLEIRPVEQQPVTPKTDEDEE